MASREHCLFPLVTACVALLACASTGDVAVAQVLTDPATIRGRVIDVSRRMPVPGARVTCMDDRIVATSDAEGRFEIRCPATPGLSVSAASPGYAGANGGERTYLQLTLQPGDTREGVELALVRPAVIVGRITEPDGQPVVGAVVLARAWRAVSGDQQAPTARDVSDDKGEFRLHSLHPGTYRVSTFAPRRHARPTRDGVVPPVLANTYYPGTIDPADAGTITVSSGSESRVDMTMRRVAPATVKGVVECTDPARRPRGVINLRLIDPDGHVVESIGQNVAGDGRFSYSVGPGRYEVLALCVGNAPERGATDDEAFTVVDVTAATTHDVVLRPHAGATLRGRLVYVDPPRGSPEPLTVLAMSLGARPRPNPQGDVGADGAFELRGVRGLVTLAIQRAQPAGGPATASTGGANAPLSVAELRARTWRVRAIRAGGRDVTNGGIDASASGEIANVEVELARDTGGFGGTVRDATGAPVPFAGVFIITADPSRLALTPVQRKWEIWRLRVADASGQFADPAIPPGDYLVAAVPQGTTYGFAGSPTEYDDFRRRALRVTIRPSEVVTRDLTLMLR